MISSIERETNEEISQRFSKGSSTPNEVTCTEETRFTETAQLSYVQDKIPSSRKRAKRTKRNTSELEVSWNRLTSTEGNSQSSKNCHTAYEETITLGENSVVNDSSTTTLLTPNETPDLSASIKESSQQSVDLIDPLLEAESSDTLSAVYSVGTDSQIFSDRNFPVQNNDNVRYSQATPGGASGVSSKPRNAINSSVRLGNEKLKRLSKMVLMSFDLRPLIATGVLMPGRNNMKMDFKEHVYIASLLADGAIEMNGLRFRSIGHWIKGIEGKRFGAYSIRDQKTLKLLYNEKPLEDLIVTGNMMLEPSTKVSENSFQIEGSEDIFAPRREINSRTKNTNSPVALNENLDFIPDSMTRHINSIFPHVPDEYFPTCQCIEQFWNGKQPFPKYLLDEVDFL